jgi:hypothetical protein
MSNELILFRHAPLSNELSILKFLIHLLRFGCVFQYLIRNVLLPPPPQFFFWGAG